jgi:hypothetical protein
VPTYQGYGRQLVFETLHLITHFATQGLKPVPFTWI